MWPDKGALDCVNFIIRHGEHLRFVSLRSKHKLTKSSSASVTLYGRVCKCKRLNSQADEVLQN